MTTNDITKDELDFFVEFTTVIDKHLDNPSPKVRAFAKAIKAATGVLADFVLDVEDTK